MTWLGLRERNEWRVKTYSILLDGERFDRDAYESMLEQAIDDELPKPAVSAHRPGVAFAIFHCGRGWDYVVLSWWDNENELPQNVYVRPNDAPGGSWRRATGGESICVWDLKIISFERDAYVKHILTPDRPDLEAYLQATYPHDTA